MSLGKLKKVNRQLARKALKQLKEKDRLDAELRKTTDHFIKAQKALIRKQTQIGLAKGLECLALKTDGFLSAECRLTRGKFENVPDLFVRLRCFACELDPDSVAAKLIAEHLGLPNK